MRVDLNKPIFFRYASLRFFENGEHHVSRVCPENVLLLVYDGVLRFSEDGTQHEMRAGEYYIQKKGLFQNGELASDAPKYLYVHFDAEWTDEESGLARSGGFDFSRLSELITRIDTASHQNRPYSEKQYLLLKLLLSLRAPAKTTAASKFADYVEKNIKNISSLSDICKEFHYSKNYVIRIFKKDLGASPFQYINGLKIKRAMYLLETTSKPITEIAEECGYSDYPYFYKRFVKSVGMSPQRWRKEIQHNPLFE